MVHAGQIDLWWGHVASDASWACNNWIDECAGDKCYVREVKNVIDSTNNRRWDFPPSNSCTGNGGSCRAVILPNQVSFTLQEFRNDNTWSKVEGCGGAIEFSNAQVSSDGNVVVTVGAAESYPGGWDGCCLLTGDTMQARGLLTDGWMCAKNSDAMAVEVNLIGKNACWQSNTRCLAGTTCNFCCSGSRWVWEWFGDHCNEGWS